MQCRSRTVRSQDKLWTWLTPLAYEVVILMSEATKDLLSQNFGISRSFASLRMTIALRARRSAQLSGAYRNATIPAPTPSALNGADRCASIGPTFTVCVLTTFPDLSRKSIFIVNDLAASV